MVEEGNEKVNKRVEERKKEKKDAVKWAGKSMRVMAGRAEKKGGIEGHKST